jgi:hypothetical protein
MTSQINPNNIDGNFPVPGVPNNTQGFRSNFTETKTNFQFAAQEITALQNNSVLKAALPGTTLDNNMNDNLLYAVKLQDVSYTYLPVAATAGAITLDYAASGYQQITTTGSISLGFANWPAAGSAGSLRVGINITNPAHTVTLPASVNVGVSRLAGVSPGVPGVSNTITFGVTGNYAFEFVTIDGGTSIWVFDQSRAPGDINTKLEISANTVSTSPTTGALQVDGGVGIVGNLNVGGMFVTYNANTDPVFSATTEGFVTINTPVIPGNTIGALSIIGSGSGSYQPIYNPGSMLHITGNDDTAARITVDSFGNAAPITYVNRSARGTPDAPGNTQSGDVLCRFVTSGWIGNTYSVNVANVAPTSVEFVATENYNSTSAGSKIEFYTSPNGAIVKTLSATIAANGITSLQSIAVNGGTGKVGYGAGAGGTVSQSGNKSGGVTLDKQSGQITMQNTALAAATTVQFTLTNSLIAATDVLVLNIVGGVATGAAYNLDATCNSGSAVISVRNITAGSLSEAIVLRYVVIKGATT